MSGDSDRKRLPTSVRAWGTVSLLSDLAHETVTAVLPALVASLGGSPVALGAIEGVSDALATGAKLVGGRLADRLQRLKGVTLIGYVITTLTLPLMALAQTAVGLGLLRAVAWTGRGLRSPLRDTLIVRSVDPALRGRAFGLERAMDQTGAVLAPGIVLLALALGLGLRPIVALSVLPGIACIVVLVRFVREGEGESEGERAEGEVVSGAMRRFLLAIALFGSGDFAKTLLVLWAMGETQGELGPELIGRGALLYGAFNLVTVGAAWFGGRASDYLGRKPVLVAGYGLGVLGTLVPVFFAPGWSAALGALVLSGLLVGAEDSVERAWAADLAGGKHGRAFGWLHSINGLGDLVASVGVGALWAWAGPATAFGAAAGMMALGTVVLATVPRGTGARPQ